MKNNIWQILINSKLILYIKSIIINFIRKIKRTKTIQDKEFRGIYTGSLWIDRHTGTNYTVSLISRNRDIPVISDLIISYHDGHGSTYASTIQKFLENMTKERTIT